MKKVISLICVCLLVAVSISVMVYADSKIQLNKKSASIKVGETVQLKVKGTDSKVKWKSRNESIATVTAKGKVTAVNIGKTTITAKVNNKKLVCKITVEENYLTLDQVAEDMTDKAQQADKMRKEEVINNLMSDMTLEEKVGQIFYVRCPSSMAVEAVSKYHLGGYILFGQDFKNKTKSEITNNIVSCQKAAKIPMLIGVDEEGGTVVRVSSNPNLRSSPFMSPRNTFNSGGWKAIETDAKQKADLLLSLGINVNMAPVCDMSSAGSFMYDRSFSDNVKMECKFVKKYVSVTKNNKLGTVLKHFPGYGNNLDTHTGIAYDNRPYSQFEQVDFKPFITGIENGADCVLVSHNIINSMDSKYPASLSKKVHKILRKELDFDGVVMTDDLAMDAIRKYTGNDTAAVFAVKSGNDILCCSDVSTQYPAVLNAVKNGEIPMKQINKSVRRILEWKYNLGLLN